MALEFVRDNIRAFKGDPQKITIAGSEAGAASVGLHMVSPVSRRKGILKAYEAYLKKNILWMKTIHYPNKTRSHLVTIVPVTPFTPKSTSKLKSAL